MVDTYLQWAREEERRLQTAIRKHRKANPDLPNSCEDLLADLQKLWWNIERHKQRIKEEREAETIRKRPRNTDRVSMRPDWMNRAND